MQALRVLMGLPNFKSKSFEAVCYAVNWYETGMDFGDALHLALSTDDDTFATFDKTLGKAATQNNIAPLKPYMRASSCQAKSKNQIGNF